MSSNVYDRYVPPEKMRRAPYKSHKEEPRIVDHRDLCDECGMSMPIFNEKAPVGKYKLCAWCTSKAFAGVRIQ